jgi:hypothetical protein
MGVPGTGEQSQLRLEAGLPEEADRSPPLPRFAGFENPTHPLLTESSDRMVVTSAWVSSALEELTGRPQCTNFAAAKANPAAVNTVAMIHLMIDASRAERSAFVAR